MLFGCSRSLLKGSNASYCLLCIFSAAFGTAAGAAAAAIEEEVAVSRIAETNTSIQ